MLAIYSPSKYILSANRSPKKATYITGIKHVESSNLSSEFPEADPTKSIYTDAPIFPSPSMTFAVESPSECYSTKIQMESHDTLDLTSKEDPNYSPDTIAFKEL